MENSTLVQANFSKVNLEGVVMDGCDVRRVVWSGAKNPDPQNALSMGTSRRGQHCTHARFALPQRKVKSGWSASSLATKHLSTVLQSVTGGGDSDDSGSDSGDESDSASEAAEGKEEEEEEEGKSWVEGMVAAVGEAGSLIQSELEEAQGFLGVEFEKLGSDAGGPLTMKSLQKQFPRAATASGGTPQSLAAQQAEAAMASLTRHCQNVLRKALQELGSKMLEKLAALPHSSTALETVPSEGQGVEAVKKALVRELVSEVHKLFGEAAKRLRSKTAVSGLAAAAATCIQSSAEKEAPSIAASVAKEVGKAQAQAEDVESALGVSAHKLELDRVREAFRSAFLDDCISKVVHAVVHAHVRAKLGKFAGGLAKKIKLIGTYERKAAKDIQGQEGTAKRRMEKLFGANTLRKQTMASVLHASTKYDLPGTGYMKQVRLVLMSIERSAAELIRDEKGATETKNKYGSYSMSTTSTYWSQVSRLPARPKRWCIPFDFKCCLALPCLSSIRTPVHARGHQGAQGRRLHSSHVA